MNNREGANIRGCQQSGGAYVLGEGGGGTMSGEGQMSGGAYVHGGQCPRTDAPSTMELMNNSVQYQTLYGHAKPGVRKSRGEQCSRIKAQKDNQG